MLAPAAEFLSVTSGVLGVMLAVLCALVIGSFIRLGMLFRADREQRSDHFASLATWWILAGLFGGSVLGGPNVLLVLLAIASLLGLQEMLTLAFGDPNRRIHLTTYAVAPVHYFLIWLGTQTAILIFIPVVMFLLIPARLLTSEHPRGYLRRVAITHWSLVVTIYLFSHIAFFYLLPDEYNPQGGAAGWVLYLVLLTECNDIAQALWGRQFGKNKIAPVISPNKTWEGFLLGMTTTILLAVALSPWLTPLWSGPETSLGDFSLDIPVIWAAVAGLLISVAGFFGDINMSGFKRDVDIKDSGTLLPGQGGILDRIDSLTFTAPIFYYYVFFLFLPA